MNLGEIFCYMEAGQYWARLKPVGLVQLITANNSPDPASSYNFRCRIWARGTPYGEEQEHCYVGPGNNDFTYLWFRKELTPDGKSSKPNYRIGDVWVTDTSELFFIGPDTTDQVIVIHSDIFISDTEISMAHLYQPGPEDNQKGLNRFQRLVQDSP
jgi:hypothetical protein